MSRASRGRNGSVRRFGPPVGRRGLRFAFPARETSLLQGLALLPLTGLFVGAILLLASCDSSPIDPSAHAMEEIRMRVTGGFAGVDYTVVLEGPAGILRGVSCTTGCAFEAGEILQNLHPHQVKHISSLFVEAGVHRMKGVDFGPMCCDFFHVEVAYRWPGGEGTFQGAIPALPEAVQLATGVLHGAVHGTLPLVVDFGTQPHQWPQDPFTVLGASVTGDFLRVKVQYGGGCNPHEFQAVAWVGWMESHPVQVRVFLSHNAFGDQCRALLTEDRYFHLGPLQRAYRESYGSGAPGSTTIVMHLENHTQGGPPAQRSLEYSF